MTQIINDKIEKTADNMKKAYELDLKFKQQNEPATAKLDAYNDLVRTVNYIHNIEVDFYSKSLSKLLTSLRLWLEPYEDGSFIDFEFRDKLLDLVDDIKVTKTNLIQSGIGQLIYFLKKYDEKYAIRYKANKIVYKWTKQILSDS